MNAVFSSRGTLTQLSFVSSTPIFGEYYRARFVRALSGYLSINKCSQLCTDDIVHMHYFCLLNKSFHGRVVSYMQQLLHANARTTIYVSSVLIEPYILERALQGSCVCLHGGLLNQDWANISIQCHASENDPPHPHWCRDLRDFAS